jgi:hypothetical protein
MHRHRLYLVAFAFAGAPAIAQGPLSLDLGGGPSFQFGQLKTNTAVPGFNGLIGVNAHAPFVPVSIRLEGLYDEYDHTSDYLGARQIWAISGNAIYSFPSPHFALGLIPYVLAGGGYYHTSENIRQGASIVCVQPAGTAPGPCTTPTVPTVTASHFGVDGGAGARYRLFGVGPNIGIGIFAEARYLYYFGPHSNAAMVPIIFGVSFPSVTSGND